MSGVSNRFDLRKSIAQSDERCVRYSPCHKVENCYGSIHRQAIRCTELALVINCSVVR